MILRSHPKHFGNAKILPQDGFIPPEDFINAGVPGNAFPGAEQYQLKDGSVKVPEVLQYLGGLELLTEIRDLLKEKTHD